MKYDVGNPDPGLGLLDSNPQAPILCILYCLLKDLIVISLKLDPGIPCCFIFF
jgi:hypothetical protein